MRYAISSDAFAFLPRDTYEYQVEHLIVDDSELDDPACESRPGVREFCGDASKWSADVRLDCGWSLTKKRGAVLNTADKLFRA